MHFVGITITDRSRFTPGLCSSKTWHKSKSCKYSTKFPFQIVYFLGIRGLIISSYIVYDNNTSGYMDLYSISTVHTIHIYLYTVYIHFYTMYLFLMQYIYNGLTSTDSGMVHSDRTGAVLLHKHFSS
jgi:hypothetical protein